MHAAPLDVCGRRRSPATLPGYHSGRPPMNKGLRYPADPPSVEEIVAVMRGAGDRTDGVRLRSLIVVLWRAGLRISEGLSLTERDLDPMRGAILARSAGRRTEEFGAILVSSHGRGAVRLARGRACSSRRTRAGWLAR